MNKIFGMLETTDASGETKKPRRLRWIVAAGLVICFVVGFVLALEILWLEPKGIPQSTYLVSFDIRAGESFSDMAERLREEKVIRRPALFRVAGRLLGIDRQIQVGTYTVERPLTLRKVMNVLAEKPALHERTVTIIPGWDMRDVAEYLASEGWGTIDEVYSLVGKPAVVGANTAPSRAAWGEKKILADKPRNVGLEGYLAPDTYRFYPTASLTDIVAKLLTERESQFTPDMYTRIATDKHTVHEVLTVASIVEREVRGAADRRKVADIFWRRARANWALQADSTVHYAVGKKGNIFTTAADRDTKNLWNTYMYPGLPPGPISNPSLDAIMATIYPEPNDYWYFLTTLEGEVKYGRTLDEHNQNRAKYLR